ncbi:MAG: hypothetical protein IJF71_04585 [Clostridia bacterium]|nr:hypothetical protein [Clostridia bacterium]
MKRQLSILCFILLILAFLCPFGRIFYLYGETQSFSIEGNGIICFIFLIQIAICSCAVFASDLPDSSIYWMSAAFAGLFDLGVLVLHLAGVNLFVDMIGPSFFWVYIAVSFIVCILNVVAALRKKE